MKFDQNLNLISNRFWQFPNPTDCHFKAGLDIKPTKDGGVIIVGLEVLETGGRRGFIAKLDINLNMEWEQKIQDEELSLVVQLDNENYLVLGKNGLYKIDSSVFFVDKILKDEMSIIFGDGKQTRDFVYVKKMWQKPIFWHWRREIMRL